MGWLDNITNSLLTLFTMLSPHRSSPRNRPIAKITVHHNAGNILLRALGEWLARLTTRASYNYGISTAGESAQFVDERDRSWASSSRENDNAAVTIGVANNRLAPYWTVSAAAWNKLIELCVDICYRNPGIVQQDGTRGLWYDGTPRGSLTTHDMFARTVCPGPYLKARMPELCREVNRRLAEILEEENMPRINNINEVPPVHQPMIRRLIAQGVIRGNGNVDAEGLPADMDLTLDMIRQMAFTERMISRSEIGQ
ncbi:MAG: N-acetylmuramoyl-L-alanine amidase [Oscillospiraceae bacterium]|nr:N-acetylmuramoyl-L-alanine amidase [Oscillospiraceae bacterium]